MGSQHLLFVCLLAATAAVLHVQTTASSSSSSNGPHEEPKHNLTIQFSAKSAYEECNFCIWVRVKCNNEEVANIQHVNVNPSYAIHVDLEKKRWYQCKGESLILFIDGFEAYRNRKAAGHPAGTKFDLSVRYWIGGVVGVAKGIQFTGKILVKLPENEKEMLKEMGAAAQLKVQVECNGELLASGERLDYNKLIKVDIENKMLSQE